MLQPPRLTFSLRDDRIGDETTRATEIAMEQFKSLLIGGQIATWDFLVVALKQFEYRLEVTVQFTGAPKAKPVEIALTRPTFDSVNLREATARHCRDIYNRCGQNARETCDVLGIAYHTLKKYLEIAEGLTP